MSKKSEISSDKTELNNTKLFTPYPEDAKTWFKLVEEGDVEKVKKFLEEHQGWDIDLVTSKYYTGQISGDTALHIASSRGNKYHELVKFLLENGANPNARDSWENTPLYFVIRGIDTRSYLDEFNTIVGTYYEDNTTTEKLELAQLMFEKGANPNLKNKSGDTPLHIGTAEKEVTALLLQYGANPNVANKEGTTPLHNAWDPAHKLLLQHGADPNAEDKKGHTFLDLLFYNCREPITAKALIEYGAIIKNFVVVDPRVWNRLGPVIQQLSPSSVVLVENAAVAENVLEANPELKPVVFDKKKLNHYLKLARDITSIDLVTKNANNEFGFGVAKTLLGTEDTDRAVPPEVIENILPFLDSNNLTVKEARAVTNYIIQKNLEGSPKTPIELYMYVAEKTSFQSQLQQQGQGSEKGNIISLHDM